MASQPDDTQVTASEIERQLLRALCSGQTPHGSIIPAIEALATYDWLVPEHAIVFQAICRAVHLNRRAWREVLPAQATRMGFPEVPWPEYFTADRGKTASLDDLVKRLIR